LKTLVTVFCALLSATATVAEELPLQLQEISLDDAAHTGSDPGAEGWQHSHVYEVNRTGQALGDTYNWDYDLNTPWFYDGAQTIPLGLAEGVYLNPITGGRESLVGSGQLNDWGQVVGTSSRYAEDGSVIGRTPWLFDGESYTTIGITDDDHTTTGGERTGYAQQINNAGQITGYNERYDLDDAVVVLTHWLYDGSEYHDIGLPDGEYISNQTTHLLEPDENGGRAFGDARRSNGGSISSPVAWAYANGVTTRVGLFDAEHTRSTDGYQATYLNYVSEAGTAIGRSWRFRPDGSLITGSNWYWDGSTTQYLGLTDGLHTDSEGEQNAYVQNVMPNGLAFGQSERYVDSADAGYTAWLFDGTTYTTVGLYNARHTGESGQQHSAVERYSPDGQFVAGISHRFQAGAGTSIWLYDGATTTNITRWGTFWEEEDGYRRSSLTAVNNRGDVVGYSNRYNEAGTQMTGWIAWLLKDGEYTDLGLVDVAHTREDGYQYSRATQISESGYVAGWSRIYQGEYTGGNTAWLYDGRRASAINVGGSAQPIYLGEDGLVIVRRQTGYSGPWDLWVHHPQYGTFDLGMRLLEWVDTYPGGQDYYPQRAVYGAGKPGDMILRVWNGFGTRIENYAEPSSVVYSLEQIVTAVMDVLPEQKNNRLEPFTDKTIPVLLKSQSREHGDAIDFSVLDIDPESLRFGFGQTAASNGPIIYDADGDEDLDALFGFDRDGADFQCGDTVVGLTGATYAAEAFTAADSIQVDVCEGSCHP
jgi:hypothetical protein